MGSIRNIPGLPEAISEERETRQDAWLGEEPDICGKPVDPLTPRKAAMLSLAGNFYLAGCAEPTAYDMGLFMWVVSPEFRPKKIRRRDRFFNRMRKLDTDELHEGIESYIERAFFDGPNQGAADHSAPKIDWIASYVHTLAETYGWSVDQCLDTPLRQSLQLRRCIHISDDPKSALRMPNRLSDPLVEDFLINANAPN